MQTTIVIPCYNEAARLDVEAFARYADGVSDLRLLLVDDGSADGTAGVLEGLRERNPPVFSVLRLERNVGKAEAVRQGFLAAFGDDPDAVGFWDADLATPLETIDEFRALLRQQPSIEMVFGSRVNLLGRSVHRNLARHYIGRVFATAASFALRLPIYDTQCGAKLFRVSDPIKAVFGEPFLSRWIFDVEIIARLSRLKRGRDGPQVRQVIYEHPLMTWRDVKGSKLKAWNFVTVGVDLVRIYFRYMVR